MPQPATEPLLTSGQAARLLGISKPTLLRAVRRGDIAPAARTLGGYAQFRSADLDLYRGGASRVGESPVGSHGAPAIPAILSAEQMSVLYDAVACGVVVSTPAGEIVAANRAAGEIWGLPAEEARGRLLGALTGTIVGEDGAELPPDARPTATAARTKRPARGVVFRLTRLDGAQRWVRVDAAPTLASDGAVRQVVTSFVDVTAHKGAEEALQAGEARYRALAEHGSDLVNVLAPDGAILYESPSYARVLGAPLADLYRAFGGPLDVLHPDDRARVRAVFAACAAGDAPGDQLIFRHRHADGSWRTLECVTTNHLADPAVRGIISTLRDVTERVAAEDALRVREQHLQAVAGNVPLVLFALDRDGTLTLSEGRGLAALGLAPGQFVGRSAFELYRDDPTILGHLSRSLAGEAVTGITTMGAATFEVRYTPLRDAAGAPAGAIGVSMDITARARAEEALRASAKELERSNAELAQFAYVASHDLQEPLRTITSYLGLIRRRYRGRLDADGDEFIGYALEGATRMSALIRDVLAYSRVGARPREFAPTDCGALVAAAVTNLQALSAETRARISCDALPVVPGDDTQLGQLFQNLIGNALKFRRPGVVPEIAVSAERRGDAWLVRVRDNGIGIAPEQAARIFQVFQRLHTREEYEGTGIGLAVCKKIVERHGGRIWVESEPGLGATFLFTLAAGEARGGDAGGSETAA